MDVDLKGQPGPKPANMPQHLQANSLASMPKADTGVQACYSPEAQVQVADTAQDWVNVQLLQPSLGNCLMFHCLLIGTQLPLPLATRVSTCSGVFIIAGFQLVSAVGVNNTIGIRHHL
jgi:hypothetical protein